MNEAQRLVAAAALMQRFLPWLQLPGVNVLWQMAAGALAQRFAAKDIRLMLERYWQHDIWQGSTSSTAHALVTSEQGTWIRKVREMHGGALDGALILGMNERTVDLPGIGGGLRAKFKVPVFVQGRKVVSRRGANVIPGFPGWDYYTPPHPNATRCGLKNGRWQCWRP